MLDNCSQASFIRNELIEDLGITGRKLQQLSLKTLIGKKSEATMAIDGFIISGIDLKKTRTNEGGGGRGYSYQGHIPNNLYLWKEEK